MNKSIAQRILHRNKILITVLLEQQVMVKTAKRYGDENNIQEIEYAAHEGLKRLRTEIAKLVLEQKELKRIVNTKA